MNIPKVFNIKNCKYILRKFRQASIKIITMEIQFLMIVVLYGVARFGNNYEVHASHFSGENYKYFSFFLLILLNLIIVAISMYDYLSLKNIFYDFLSNVFITIVLLIINLYIFSLYHISQLSVEEMDNYNFMKYGADDFVHIVFFLVLKILYQPYYFLTVINIIILSITIFMWHKKQNVKNSYNNIYTVKKYIGTIMILFLFIYVSKELQIIDVYSTCFDMHVLDIRYTIDFYDVYLFLTIVIFLIYMSKLQYYLFFIKVADKQKYNFKIYFPIIIWVLLFNYLSRLF